MSSKYGELSSAIIGFLVGVVGFVVTFLAYVMTDFDSFIRTAFPNESVYFDFLILGLGIVVVATIAWLGLKEKMKQGLPYWFTALVTPIIVIVFLRMFFTTGGAF